MTLRLIDRNNGLIGRGRRYKTDFHDVFSHLLALREVDYYI